MPAKACDGYTWGGRPLIEFSPLNLAYIGDAVFSLMAREAAMKESGDIPTAAISNKTDKLCCARAQAAMYFVVLGMLTDEEEAVLKSGRNQNSRRNAKNSNITEYRRATGLEALFGYLYLRGDKKRLHELFECCIMSVDGSEVTNSGG